MEGEILIQIVQVTHFYKIVDTPVTHEDMK